MTCEEYHETQEQAMKLVKELLRLDLSGMLGMISRSNAIAPMLDPTLYHQGMSALNMMERAIGILARAKGDLERVELRPGISLEMAIDLHDLREGAG